MISSVVERFVHIEDVRSSNLLSPTTLPLEINEIYQISTLMYKVFLGRVNLVVCLQVHKVQHIYGVGHVFRQVATVGRERDCCVAVA